MPVFAALFLSIFNKVWSMVVFYLGARLAIRVGIILGLAGLYVAGLASFNAFVQPLLSALFNTQYGQLLGLIFPPIAGTVIAGLIGLWVGKVTYEYFERFGLALLKV